MYKPKAYKRQLTVSQIRVIITCALSVPVNSSARKRKDSLTGTVFMQH